MSLFARVDSSMNGSVEVWIESTAGWTSDIGLVETSEFSQASGSWFGELDEQLAVPILLPAPSHPGGVVPPSPTGDLILPPDDPGVNGPPPVPDWTPGLSVEGPAGNLHTASLRLFARFGSRRSTPTGKTTGTPATRSSRSTRLRKTSLLLSSRPPKA